MFQQDRIFRRRDRLGRAWDIHQTLGPGVIVWRARNGSFLGKNIANVLTTDRDGNRLPVAFLADIQVNPSAENNGVGSMLLSLAIAACKARGHSGIEGELVEVDSGHFDKLKHFYEKLGFAVTFYSPEDPRYNQQRRGEIQLEF